MKALANFLILAATFHGGAALACDNPSLLTSIPAGAESTQAQMLAAQTEVRAYLTAMELYIECLEAELEASGDEAGPEIRSMIVSRINSAVSEMERVAELFNQELRAFREANPAPSQ